MNRYIIISKEPLPDDLEIFGPFDGSPDVTIDLLRQAQPDLHVMDVGIVNDHLSSVLAR
jgi:hypothetical protein